MNYEQAYQWLHGDRTEYSGCHAAAEAMDGEVRRLRQLLLAKEQPAPVDLKQFREAVECWHDAALPANSVDAERKAEAKRLLALIDNAGKVECSEVSGCIATVPDKCDRIIWRGKYYHLPPRQPAPVVDDTRMARALEWVRAECGLYNNAEARTHLPAIEEAIAAYDPNCGARTVCVVDDAMADQIIKGNVDLVPAEHQTLEQQK